MQILWSVTCFTSLSGLVHVSVRTLASMKTLWMSIVLVNESEYRQLGKWSRCLIFSFSSPEWIGWLWDIRPKLVVWSDSFFSLISTVSSVKESHNKIPSHLYPETPIHTPAWTPESCSYLTIGRRCEQCHAHSYYLTNLCEYWDCSTSSPKGPWLRYPCRVTHKDSQRSGSEGTEGPQMELHRLALLCPSAVISPHA